jgi:hypothetical protein
VCAYHEFSFSRRRIRISASISLATSFHFRFGDAADEEVSFIFIGFVRSCSEKSPEEAGERTEGCGDLGSCILFMRGGGLVKCGRESEE